MTDFEFEILQVVSVSKPRTLKFYKITTWTTDEKGKPKAEKKPVVCMKCKQSIRAESKVRTAEVIALVKEGTDKTRHTAHLPVCSKCNPK